MSLNQFHNAFAREQFMASMFNTCLNCGNYDGDDDENCDDYDPDEDLRMMYDEEDYDEMYEG